MIEAISAVLFICCLPLLCLCATGVARPTNGFTSGSNDPYCWIKG